MTEKGLMMALAVSVAMFGALVIHDHLLIKKITNYPWHDSWGKVVAEVPAPPLEGQNTPEVAPAPLPDATVAATYEDAMRLSGETGKPIFLYFEASWCGPCKQMKTKTLVDEKVKEALKNYIVCFVDSDKEKDLVKKFKVRGLPSYFVTNSNSDILVTGVGYTDAPNFLKLINDPKLFVQPKKEPSKKEIKDQDRNLLKRMRAK